MMHVKNLSKPAKAEQTADVTLKNIIGPIAGVSLLGDETLTEEQRNWMWDQINDALSK
ncbi:MAG TPA: hypothetical protein PLM14_06050 [Candidatus Hydrogenedentes bacterium]|nr:hypothetical protein [Candidatus Hydrogenedentota bacterium]HQE82544.1 hypothetical protein [Candidatus Hydrogenedentota bacterium]HQH52684.1 hypothetical protein [Candidatus Hydrogenedentota bacterium]HQM51039.1 hypothetical protein [Candidatus Hydrogenedentota bacterium]